MVRGLPVERVAVAVPALLALRDQEGKLIFGGCPGEPAVSFGYQAHRVGHCRIRISVAVNDFEHDSRGERPRLVLHYADKPVINAFWHYVGVPVAALHGSTPLSSFLALLPDPDIGGGQHGQASGHRGEIRSGPGPSHVHKPSLSRLAKRPSAQLSRDLLICGELRAHPLTRLYNQLTC